MGYNSAMDNTYRLVFQAEVLDGQHRAVVKRRLAEALDLSEQQMEKLFAGAPVVVKKQADKKTAARYQTLFKNAGARLRVVRLGGSGAAFEAVSETAAEILPETDVAPGASQPAEASAFALAEVGAVLSEPQLVVVPERLLNVQFDVAEAGIDLLQGYAPAPAPRAVADVDFGVAEVGADLGELKKPVTAVVPDISHLKLVAY